MVGKGRGAGKNSVSPSKSVLSLPCKYHVNYSFSRLELLAKLHNFYSANAVIREGLKLIISFLLALTIDSG